MKNQIFPTGKFNELDSEGFIKNSGIYPIIQEEYTAPVNKSVELTLEKFGNIIHSIYIRGSVSKGIAIHNVSDIDFIFLSFRPITKEEKEILYLEFEPQIIEQYPFINGIEFHFIPMDFLQKNQFLFSTQCANIFGEDINLTLPKFKIDKCAFAHIYTLKNDMSDAFDDKHSCAWIMKRMVRVGFELCMIRAQKYTRDLYPCYETFAEYYPERKEEMFEALSLAIFPTEDSAEISRILNNLGLFLLGEIEQQKLIS